MSKRSAPPTSGEKVNAFYAQSGGVTAVINCSAAGVIETARKHNSQIGTVYAGRNGIIGALNEDLIDTNLESEENIKLLMNTPSGAFGSCRFKLKGFEQNQAEYERLINVFKAHNIQYFFYNGGGDSADTCYKVSQISQKMGYPVQAIHIPKTIDNDLPITDNCPGFGSVAKYVAVSALEASYDVKSMCASSTKIFVLEVMGRHAGWIAAAGALVEDYNIPVVVLFPEIPFDQEKFLAAVQSKTENHGCCTIIVSEGTKWPDGKFLAEQGMKDDFGHVRLGGAAPVVAHMIGDNLGYKYHWAVADYLQRAARHLASKTDVDQAYALGKVAVEKALEGKNAIMTTVIRGSNGRSADGGSSTGGYSWTIGEAPLEKVANVEKMMPTDYISADGFGITASCKEYLYPLMRGEAAPAYDMNGMPMYVQLKNAGVPKKLPPFVPTSK